MAVNAHIGSALSITQGVALDYGVIVPHTTASTVSMTAGGVLSQTGSATIQTTGTAGTFSISGASGKTVAITYDSPTISDGANTMSFTPDGCTCCSYA